MGVQPSAAPLASNTQALWAIISHWMTPGNHGVAGKVPLEEVLVPPDVALAVGHAVDKLHLVHQQHGLPVGENLLDFFFIHNKTFLL